jgi:hypothetical protein
MPTFFFNPNFYYLSMALQAICVYHCIRKGNQNKWIWIIVFLPVIGCLIYFFSEIVTSRDINKVQSGLGEFINPSGSIKKLEDNVRFSDTFNNRIALADAYLVAGFTDKAIEIYESNLKGAFVENEHVLAQLVMAYNQKKDFHSLISTAEKIKALPQFANSHCHVLYANALTQAGFLEKGETEFLKMNSKYSHYEARYCYALFLMKEAREIEAHNILSQVVSEARHLSSGEKRYYRTWLTKAKEELRKLESVPG